MRSITIVCGFLFLGLFNSGTVFADFNSALKAYETQNFAAAFTEFKRLAELGDVSSQRNLAAMYARGEHVTQDLVEAYAWATLVVEQAPKETNFRDAISSQLDESALEHALTRAVELNESYGVKALQKTILPIPSDAVANCSVEASGDVVAVSMIAPRYPTTAAQHNQEGWACFEFYLDRDGSPKRLSVTKAIAYNKEKGSNFAKDSTTFVAPSISAIKQWKFVVPADEVLRENKRNYCLDYKLEGMTSADRKEVKRLVEDLTEDADDTQALLKMAEKYENAASQMRLSNKSKAQSFSETANALTMRSAIYGNAEAQYKIASNLLTGNYCEKDVSKGVLWLTFAAQQGHAPSQYLLANQLLQGNSIQAQPEKALTWYKTSAEAGYGPAKLAYLRLALQQANANVDELYGLLPQPINENDMRQLEIVALVSAKKGDFIRAQALQKKVLEIADELQFDKDSRMQQLQKYAANQF